MTWMGRRPWKRPHSAGKLYIDCRKWWSKTRFILRIYQGPTRLRRRKPLHWALPLISYHIFVYYTLDYCTYSRIVGPSGLAGVLNAINQSIKFENPRDLENIATMMGKLTSLFLHYCNVSFIELQFHQQTDAKLGKKTQPRASYPKYEIKLLYNPSFSTSIQGPI